MNASIDSAPGFSVVGTRPVRPDGFDKVTGAAVYGADTRFPGMIIGKILRSPHAHARILNIATDQARAIKGVRAVLTRRDLANPPTEKDDACETVDLRYARDNVLAGATVLYKGHAVAAVAADSAAIADQALEAIRVEYEILSPVLDILEAMRDDAPLLHEELRTESFDGTITGGPSNVARHLLLKLGDPEAGFKESDVVVEHEFTTDTVHQGYIEPQAATAWWKGNDELTVWCSTQGAFGVRKQLSAVLGHPDSCIRVVPLEIGGGFGGKLSAYLEPVAARLSQITRRPVKMTMSRTEVFESTGPAPASVVRIRMGATRAGKIVAAEAWLAYAAGAFPGSQINPGGICAFAPYAVANLVVDGYDVVVNKPKSGAFRAPGAPQANFGVECVVDELASKLEFDPFEFRLMNAAREGTRRADGVRFARIGCVEVIQAAKSHPHYLSPHPGENCGRGVAVGYWRGRGPGGGSSHVIAIVSADGSVELLEGSVDIGGSRASVAMMFAETLGIPLHSVRPSVVDTGKIGYTDNTAGSRTTYATGLAAHRAGVEIKRQMCDRAAMLWEVDAAEVKYRDGGVSHRTESDLWISFRELAGKMMGTGGVVVGQAAVHPGSMVTGSFVACLVDVHVDPQTGKARVLRCTLVQDAGRAIHPSYVEGQMQGGVTQGLGWALHEGYFFDRKGGMSNSSFLDYRMPTAFDLPLIETVIVEVPDPDHPFGVRGIGESSIVSPMAAVSNAIANALGIRLRALPMSPDRVMARLG